MQQSIKENEPNITIELGKNTIFEHDIKSGNESLIFNICNLRSGSLIFPIDLTYRDFNNTKSYINPLHASFNQYVLRSNSPSAEKDEFTYVDGSGKHIEFKTKYYYKNTNNKNVYIEGNNVYADEYGKLYYNLNNNKKEVFVERKSNEGLILMATIEGVNGISKVEQHSKEIAQLNSVIKNYEKAINEIELAIEDCDAASLNSLSAIICSTGCSRYNDCKNSSPEAKKCLLLTNIENKSEYYKSYVSAVIQRNIAKRNYLNTTSQITIQELQRTVSNLQIDLQNMQFIKAKEDSVEANLQQFYELLKNKNENIRSCQGNVHNNSINLLKEQFIDAINQYNLAILNLENIKKAIIKQRDLLNDYKNELNKNKRELNLLYLNTPEIFIMFNQMIYCFAKCELDSIPSAMTGYRLLNIIDSYENQLTFNYDENKMLAISNNNGDLLSCNYDSNNNLASICDMHGHNVVITKIDSSNYEVLSNNGKSILSLNISNSPIFIYNSIKKICVKKETINYGELSTTITDNIKIKNDYILKDKYIINSTSTSIIVQKNEEAPTGFSFDNINIFDNFNFTLFYKPQSIDDLRLVEPLYYSYSNYNSNENSIKRNKLDLCPNKNLIETITLNDVNSDENGGLNCYIGQFNFKPKTMHLLICKFNDNDDNVFPNINIVINGVNFSNYMYALSETQCISPIPFTTTSEANIISLKIENGSPFSFKNIDILIYECDAISSQYDDKDRLVKRICSDISTTNYTYEYNDNDLLIKETETNPDGEFTTEYFYNNYGSPLKIIDSDNMITEYKYNSHGVQIGEKRYNSINPDVFYQSDTILDSEEKILSESDDLGRYEKQTYNYDLQDRVTTTFNAENTAISYIYNDNGEMLSITSDDGIETSSNILEYDKFGNVKKVKHSGGEITYDYDYANYATISSIKINGNNYAKITEGATKDIVEYSTCETFIKNKDDDGNLLSVEYSQSNSMPTVIVKNEYNKHGKLIKQTDTSSDICYSSNINYNEKNLVEHIEYKADDSTIFSSDYSYNNDMLTNVKNTVNNFAQNYKYSYQGNLDKVINRVELNDSEIESIEYDSLGRIKKIINNEYCKVLSYLSNGGRTSDLVSQVREFKNNVLLKTILYKYDLNNNIVSILENGLELIDYKYDKLNRVIRENNRNSNITTLYTYDNSGNILQKTIYPYYDSEFPTQQPIRQDKYTYPNIGWMDKLVSFNNEQCVYDNLGNPTVYRDNSLSWIYGRQLASFGNTTYKYYADGMRRQKIADGVSSEYIWSNGQLVAEIKENNSIVFKYGVCGVLGFTHNNKQYTYRKNLQGDITDIVDENGDIVAHYDYDAFGNQRIFGWYDNTWRLLEDTLTHDGIFASNELPMQLPYVFGDKTSLKKNHIAYINPFRYRGYYYDVDTNLYYLLSRYYDSETGRFINADDISYTHPDIINGINLFAYCLNNPISYYDFTGKSILLTLLAAFGLGALFGGISSAVSGAKAGKTGWGLFHHILGGVLIGGTLGVSTALGGLFGIGAIGASFAGIGFLAATAVSFGIGIVNYGLQNVWFTPGSDWNWGKALTQGVINATQGAIGFGLGALISNAGLWGSLNKKQWSSTFKALSQTGISGISSIFKASNIYMQTNLSQMLVRFFITSIFVKPWNLLKYALNK